MAKRKRRRLTYREHTDEQIRNAWKAAVSEDSIIMDWLSLCLAERVCGIDEFERGRAEGRREKCGEIIEMVLTEPDIEVKKNLED